MAAPEYVPVKPMDDVRTYESPPRRPGSWLAQRPGDLKGETPRGKRFGNPGPDQGYGLVLGKRLADQLRLHEGEQLDDVVEGALAVALRRASILGRAPVIHDFTVAYCVYGFLEEHPNPLLLEIRRRAFGEVAVPAHYAERQRIGAAVREEALRMPHAAVIDAHTRDWRALLDVDVLTPAGHG
ncbi:MAG TPA: hypothetical protein VGZ52_06485 [Acidimicrobiales bacterium]|jgi:hypothetical protein|nr:hypothetical protein [Acidimicrobiales bacterium]